MPDRPQIVIVNSTPIISLALISKLELLKHLYDKVLTPPAVQAEVLAGGIRGAGIEQFQQANTTPPGPKASGSTF
jgi:predicted nucleic acid-binding protein